MPPNNRKKKKPISNPARGFATVSVPSKPKVVASTPDSTATTSTVESTPVEDAERLKQSGPSNLLTAAKDATETHQYTPEELERHLEDAELQILVERFAFKCKNDATRQASRLETEQRVTRQQAVPLKTLEWLSPEMVDSVIKFAESEEHDMGRSSARESNGSRRPESQEDITIRLWTLKETLLKAGFSEPRVEESLKHAIQYFSTSSKGSNRDSVWNLDECLEWLAMHCSPEELPPYTRTAVQIANDSDRESWITDRDPSGSPVPSGLRRTAPKKSNNDSRASTMPSSPYDSDSSLDPDTLTPDYLRLQTELYKTRPEIFDRPKKKGKIPQNLGLDDHPEIARLQRKLAKIEQDVLFDKDEAELQWGKKLDQLRKDAEFSRRENAHSSAATKLEAAMENKIISEPSRSPSPCSVREDGGLLGDMFDAELALPNFAPTTKTTDNSMTLRDFGKWTGLSPRRVLEETCKSRDAGCALIFKDFSSSSYSNRQAVEVRWSKPQDLLFPLDVDMLTIKSSPYTTYVSMDKIGTPTQQQAEAYVSTVALLHLFPQSSKEGKAYLRLPAVWRELYAEVADIKKKQEDEIDKTAIRELRRLIQENSWSMEDDVVLSDNFRKRNTTAETRETAPKGRAQQVSGAEDILKQIWWEKASTPAFHRMIQGRKTLPIWQFKEEILDTLETHRAIIICSETGSGKSTQIPSFILEHELLNNRSCKIYVTEPRRISAISLARRVSEELGEYRNDVGTARSLVGFAVRLESKVSQSTRLVYATTGVVVRMLEQPENFRDITHVVLDEVHERSIDSDFLLIILRRLMQTRPDLKLVLMSATLEAQRFSSYLGGVPVMNIPGRTFPVEVKYLEDAIEMTDYRLTNNEKYIDLDDDTEDTPGETVQADGPGGILTTLGGYSKSTKDTVLKFDEYRLDYKLITRLLVGIASRPDMEHYSKAILVFMPGLAEIRRLNDEILSEPTFQGGWIVHVLHSSIASEDQERAFLVPPNGMRKIVIATNIAETGITIPDITAVIDAGKEKSMRFDERRQLSRLVETFISRANAKQRRGRAGRVQNGICFHLFTKHRHDTLLAEQQTPEMLRLSLQDLVLRVKICKLGEVEPTLLEALDPPSSKNIRRAIDSLKEVKALTSSENLTPLGMQLAKLPLDVFLGKLIIHGAFFRCLDAAVSIAAILSSKSPFINAVGSSSQRDLARLSFKKGDSDLLTVYDAYCAWRRVRSTPGGNEFSFCRKNLLSPQTLSSIEDVKLQLLVSIADTGLLNLDQAQKTALNRARSGGRQRQFFVIPAEYDINTGNDLIVNSVIAWSFYPKLLTREGKGWRNVANNQAVSLHPTSVNKQADSTVKWLSYYHIMQSRSRAYNAHETSAVEDFAIALLCGDPDFKMYSGVISIDSNRIRFSVRDWKTMLALKILSARIRDILSGTFRHPHKKLSYKQQQWMEIWQQIFSQVGKRI